MNRRVSTKKKENVSFEKTKRSIYRIYKQRKPKKFRLPVSIKTVCAQNNHTTLSSRLPAKNALQGLLEVSNSNTMKFISELNHQKTIDKWNKVEYFIDNQFGGQTN